MRHLIAFVCLFLLLAIAATEPKVTRWNYGFSSGIQVTWRDGTTSSLVHQKLGASHAFYYQRRWQIGRDYWRPPDCYGVYDGKPFIQLGARGNDIWGRTAWIWLGAGLSRPVARPGGVPCAP